MDITNIFSLLGGLALFLYGMHMMSNGLEIAAGDKMQMILEKITSNRFLGIIVGAGITAVIQSSSATTVMVISFVNSGLMKLEKAVWIIMGANIGTTITGQLIALDISQIAPIIAVIGVIMATMLKKKRVNAYGEIIGGLGILFIGMGAMSTAMAPLRDNAAFVQIMTNFSNPLLGILAGAVFTAIIQSSSASIGILQALASSGAIPLQSAVFVLFGQNIGTCITSFIASLSGNRNSKRAVLVHFLFNAIGTIIFVSVCMLLPFTQWIAEFTPGNPMAQIANVHTIFNITTTLLLLPFGTKLVALTYKLLPMGDLEREDAKELTLLSELSFGSSLVAINSLRNEIAHMFRITKRSLTITYNTFINGDPIDFERIERNEKKLNRINYEINKFMTNVSKLNMQDEESLRCSALFKLGVDIERIGDHIENLAEYALHNEENKRKFSAEQREELLTLYKNIEYIQDLLLQFDINDNSDYFDIISAKEEEVDVFTEKYRISQIDRLQEKRSNPEVAVIYSEMLTDLERISDYLMNVAESCQSYKINLINNE